MRITREQWAKLGTGTEPKATYPVIDAMNKTERRYSDHLQVRKLAGEIRDFWFEAFKVRLADSTFYTVDFLVILADNTVEFHEVKGFMREDAILKIKFFVETYPFSLVVVKWVNKTWESTRYQAKSR